MPTRSNRTFICSVAFLDIVEYSRKPVAQQIELKERLNQLLAEALQDVAENDRIILDTGDGAAVSFVGDPEDALFVCLALRAALAAPQPGGVQPLGLRMGINLGPVKLIRDLNGQPNIIGDGINVAQRVMSFAAPNQILVSRSYYEVVSCLSDAYAKLFRYEGSRTDKHVREHEVYAVGEGASGLRRSLAQPAARPRPAAGLARASIGRLAALAARAGENLRARPRLATAVAVAAILGAALLLRALREPPPAPAEPVAAEAPAPSAPAVPAAEPPAPAVPAQTASAPAAPKRAPAQAKPLAPAGDPGYLSFAISPWGEVYVNGKRQGVSPPLQEIEVAPGRHRIEIRNTTFPPYSETVEVKPGARIKIRHRFH
jgi:class 3 adenylate cyclase